MSRNFRRNGFTSNMFFDSSRQVPAGLANVTIGALFTLKFVYNIGGETNRHTVFVGENISRFKSFENNTETMRFRNDFIDGVNSF